MLTGCFLFQDSSVGQQSNISTLVLVKNIVDGKVHSSDGLEALVTSTNGQKHYTIRHDYFAIDENTGKVVSVELYEEGASLLSLRSGDSAGTSAQETAVIYDFFSPDPESKARETVTTLQNGVAVTNLSGTKGSYRYYQIQVPSGSTKVTFQMYGGSGDADLYVKRGSLPTLSSFDARPYLYGNNETVIFNSPQANTYYVMIHAYSAYNGVSIKATIEGGSTTTTDIVTLSNGVSVIGISGSSGNEKYYKIVLASSASSLVITISGGSGDADLYTRKDALPTVNTYDYRPYLSGNNETVTYTNPVAGTYYIMIRGYSSYSSVSLKATYTSSTTPEPDAVTTLSNNTAVTGISGARLSQLYFKIAVPTNATSLTVKMSEGSGDADLYTKRGSLPTLSNYDYRPYLSGNNEQITYSSPSSGDYYIMVRGYAAFSGVRLVATYQTSTSGGETEVVTVYDNVTITGLSCATSGALYFQFVLAQAADSLQIAISGSTGDADLYVKKGNLPTTSSYDYRPYLNGSNETVTISTPTAGTFYIMIRAYSSFSGLTLLVKTTTSDPDPDPATGNRKALLLGLTNYGGSGDLNYTDDDANDLGTVFTNLNDPFTVQKQTGYVTKSQILNWIQSYVSSSASGDIFVFSYSGHGMYSSGQSYLYLSDGGSMSVTELKNALNQLNGTKIVLIDACESGNFTSMILGREVSLDELRVNRDLFLTTLLEAFKEEENDGETRGSYESPYEYYVLAACKTTEYSYEDSTLKNGYFTFFFADGLGHVGESNPSGTFDSSYEADGYGTGGSLNNTITFQEIYNYTKTKVTNYSGGDQTVQGNYTTASFVIGVYD
jgi:hypothetical protein